MILLTKEMGKQQDVFMTEIRGGPPPKEVVRLVIRLGVEADRNPCFRVLAEETNAEISRGTRFYQRPLPSEVAKARQEAAVFQAGALRQIKALRFSLGS